MPRPDVALETLDLLYRAALEPRLWPVALGRLAQAAGCIGTAMISITPHDTTTGLVVSPAMDESAAEYRQGWWRYDTRVGRIFDLRLSRGVFAEAQLFTVEELARDPMRQEFCASHGFGAFAAQLVEPWPGHVVAFSVQRALKHGHFEGSEIDTLNWLGRHAARALTISLKLMAGNAVADGLIEVLDKFGGGVFVLNRRREVTLMNASAERLLGDGLMVVQRGVLACAPERQQALDLLISSAFDESGAHPELGPIALPRQSRKRPLLVQAMPLPSRRASDRAEDFAGGLEGVLILVVDPEQAVLQPIECLRLLGLTTAEARLASLVGSGMRRRDAATVLGISEWTARATLKLIYSKLDISSQGELVRLVSRIAAVEKRRQGVA